MIGFRSKINELKLNFRSDRLGFSLKAFAILFAFLDIVTLPSFTFRTGFNLISILLSVLFVTAAFAYIVFRGEFRFCWLIVPYVIFVFYCLLSYAFTRYSFSAFRTLCLVYGLMFAVFEFSANLKKPKLLMDFFILSTVLLAALIFLDNYRDILSLSTDRIGAKYGNLNQIGWIFATGFFFCFYRLLFARGHFVIFSLIALIDLAFAILTGSRGALVILGISLIMLLFLFFKGKKKIYFALACLILAGAVFLILQIPSFSELKDRLYQMVISLLSGGSDGDASSNSRFAMLKEGIYLFAKSPVIGNGLDAFAVLSNQIVYSHSNLSEMLCNFGLAGLAIWLAPLIIASIIELKHKKSPLCLAYSIGVILPSMFFSILYQARFFSISVAICLSFLACEDVRVPGLYLTFVPKPSIRTVLGENSWFKKVYKTNESQENGSKKND